MKRFFPMFSTALAALFSLAAAGQTLNVHVGNVSYLFPASQAGDMVYDSGTTLTVMGKTFPLDEIDEITVDDVAVTDNLVSVDYSGTTATVSVAGNAARYVEASVSGAHVTIVTTNSGAVDGDEITVRLCGSTDDGSLVLDGSYRTTVSLGGVAIGNPSGAAICINDSKRIQVRAEKGTENVLSDGADGTQKACLYSKGQLQLQGNGVLSVAGHAKHAIKSASYVSIKNLTLNVTAAQSDGISCEEYFEMKSGSVTIGGVGDDGIQCDLGGDSPTGETDGHEDEDTGNIYLEGGSLTVTAEAVASKCIKAEGSIAVSGGTVTLNVWGAADTDDATDISTAAGFKADGDFTQSGGTVTVNVTGASGRGVAVDGSFLATAGNTGSLTIDNSGALTSVGTTCFVTAKGIKAGQVMVAGGTVSVSMAGAAAKGIQGDEDDGAGTIAVSGGTLNVTVSGAGAYDGTERDAKGAACLKADKDLTVSGGTVTLKATGTGGKCIKSDGTFTLTDGSLTAIATGAQYRYSSSATASAKAVKSTGNMTISGGKLVASSASHEGVETKGTLTITGGDVYAEASDDAINSASHMTIEGGFVMANSSGNDGLDANGNLYIKGGNVFAVASSSPEVGIDANTEGGYALYISGGNVAAIGGLERGCSITNGSAYQASSYSKGAWYALLNGSGSVAFAFKVPSNSRMGTPLCVYTSGSTSLLSGVTGSGTALWNGNGYTAYSGGTTVSLSSYSSGGGGGQPGGGGGPGGGGTMA